MYSLEEALLALRGVKSLGNVFVIAALTYNRMPKGFFTMMGEGVAPAARALEDAGADAIGSNCGLGSGDMVELAAAIRAATRMPILIQPNAGKPETVKGSVVYRQSARRRRRPDQGRRRRHDRRLLRHHSGLHPRARQSRRLSIRKSPVRE